MMTEAWTARMAARVVAGVVCAAAFIGSAPAGGGAVALAGTGAGKSTVVVARHVFGQRYCELLLVHKHGAGFAADVFNTYGLNKCPAAAWDAIDTTAVAQANGALAALRNGPRFWAMDTIQKHRPSRPVIKDLGGVRMIEEAIVSATNLSTSPYTIHRVDRATTFTFNAGRTVYELHGTDGSRWVMQSWSRQVDPTLSLAGLAGLGSRLTLPAGWSYHVVHLKRPLQVVTVKTAAEVLQDDFDDTYSRLPTATARDARAEDTTPAYATGFALGTKAYDYGVPLLDAERVYASQTSSARCNPATGQGPVNVFCSFRRLATPSEKGAPGPNLDTLYTSAWLTNLNRAPEVIHAPAIKDRFWEFELLDPWTNDFYNITSIPQPLGPGDFGVTNGGDWALVGPGFHGHVPSGLKVIHTRYDRIWIAGRTFVRGPSDLASVHRIQAQYTITPLSRFGKPAAQRRPAAHKRSITATIPGTQPGEEPLDFYAALNREMAKFPPPAADQPLLGQLKAIGVGPGLKLASAHLSADTLQGMRDAVTQGHAGLLSDFLQLYLKDFAEHDGYVIGDLGNWGIDYTYRAISDAIGIGGQRANIALYPVALFDDTKAPLNASNRYVLHIPADRLPIPVSAFWSLTIYDSNSYLVPNPLHRYAITNLSHLHKNPDGSIDIYVQSTEPSDPGEVSNWLPSPPPGNGFRLFWRLYGLGRALPGVLNGTGWEPPLIQPCDATGHGNDGTPCA
jgi:hypothetical protein